MSISPEERAVNWLPHLDQHGRRFGMRRRCVLLYVDLYSTTYCLYRTSAVAVCTRRRCIQLSRLKTECCCRLLDTWKTELCLTCAISRGILRVLGGVIQGVRSIDRYRLAGSIALENLAYCRPLAKRLPKPQAGLQVHAFAWDSSNSNECRFI